MGAQISDTELSRAVGAWLDWIQHPIPSDASQQIAARDARVLRRFVERRHESLLSIGSALHCSTADAGGRLGRFRVLHGPAACACYGVGGRRSIYALDAGRQDSDRSDLSRQMGAGVFRLYVLPK